MKKLYYFITNNYPPVFYYFIIKDFFQKKIKIHLSVSEKIKLKFKEKDMTNKMVSNSFQKKSERFILHNDTSPIMQEGGYELFPVGHIISFPSFWDYKKIKNFNKTISRFLERRREIYDDVEVLKCLELIESLIEDCDVSLDTKEDYSYKVDFPAIIEFINKVGYVYNKDEKLYDGNKFFFVNESNMVKEKYSNIVEKLYRKNIAF